MSLGCNGPTQPGCDGGPVAGEVSLWSECASHALAGSVPLTLTNGTAETVWFYHECGDEVPWPDVLEADGTWTRLLPGTFFLPTGCEHVMELAPGESMELAMSTQHAPGAGTYRGELAVAYGCTAVHHPTHVPHRCARVEFVVSAPFVLE